MIEKVFEPAEPHGDGETPDMSRIGAGQLFMTFEISSKLSDFARAQTEQPPISPEQCQQLDASPSNTIARLIRQHQQTLGRRLA